MKENKITVIGSSNTDLIVKMERIPSVGETVLGGDFVKVPGGKGANQAVAAKLLGLEVDFIAKLGADDFGLESLENYKKVGLNLRHIKQTDKAASGVAFIFVDKNGSNCIAVAPGSNSLLGTEDVNFAESEIASSRILLSQLEVPLSSVKAAGILAKKHEVLFILDPAPALKLNEDILSLVDIITPNESEAEFLTGVTLADMASYHLASDLLIEKGVKNVILTLGEKGFFFKNKQVSKLVPALKVEVVDTTAAGDAFAAGLAWGINRNKSFLEAAEMANYVSALSVTKFGAQSSLPTENEVLEFISKTKGITI